MLPLAADGAESCELCLKLIIAEKRLSAHFRHVAASTSWMLWH